MVWVTLLPRRGRLNEKIVRKLFVTYGEIARKVFVVKDGNHLHFVDKDDDRSNGGSVGTSAGAR